MTLQETFDAGLAAVDRKEWAAAAELFDRALLLDRNNVRIAFNLGNAWLQAGRKDCARGAVNWALTLDPDFPNLRFLAGNLLVEMGDFKTAIDHYIVAVQQDPLNPTLHTNMAEAFGQLRLHEEACELFEFALALGGDRSALYSALHHAGSQACRWDITGEAKRRFDEHLARGGQNHAAPFQLLCM